MKPLTENIIIYQIIYKNSRTSTIEHLQNTIEPNASKINKLNCLLKKTGLSRKNLSLAWSVKGEKIIKTYYCMYWLAVQ